MQGSSSKISTFQWLILIFWIVFTVSAFAYFTSDRLIDFDADDKLQGMDAKKLSPHFEVYIKNTPVENKKTILHFSTPDCECQINIKSHSKAIDRLAKRNAFQVQHITIDEHDVIPSTPSIAVLGNDGQVVYFGPYGQGLTCNETSGFAQTVLNNYLKGYANNIVIKEAQGCYCPT
ncbi:hypothetical protein CW745_10585 [Psychromonas sp. psych-6C06]|uniref:DUF6436 domain-containing protein n=1 Tax=Psychromonas sp. psych-6C06 TaxID=2058089 RepID=UPI000C32B947|nr:DUF6436 domain-containing protein [Psychromonas sp. psych-6C06]PKF61752.1 hypothetical protein CW745_10585 [Psychromonas sp. psych-6C06]